MQSGRRTPIGARLRKIAATRVPNAGSTVAQLEAIFGWTGDGRMASLYTRAADRRRVAIESMHKLANVERTSIPAPLDEVRASGEKANNFKAESRGCRGSDPRLLRLTMDALLDRHMWGATPCIKDRQRPRSDLPDMGLAKLGRFYGQIGTACRLRDIFVTPLPPTEPLPTYPRLYTPGRAA
jgi:hypothetical protein